MEKPIIATTFAGLYVKSEPWKKAHILWFQEASEKLGDDSIKNWAFKPNYFREGVDEVMKKLYPKLTDSERTEKARESFFDSVCKYAGQNLNVRNSNVIEYFRKLKTEYRLALITTNTASAIKKLLGLLDLQGFFDIIETSQPNEKDDKVLVFDRFAKSYGIPIIYIGSDRKDSFDYCKKNGIRCLFANFENSEEIVGVDSVHDISELEGIISELS